MIGFCGRSEDTYGLVPETLRVQPLLHTVVR
jgi:hypothetical protein